MNGWSTAVQRLSSRFGCLFLLSLFVFSAAVGQAATFYVATNGHDSTGDGSTNNPWKTIAHAVNSGIPASGGHTILVRNGLYDGANIITRGFASEVIVRAEEDHGAVLTNLVTSGFAILAVYTEGSANLTVEGFVFTAEDSNGPICSSRVTFMIHFQDSSDITFRNNIAFGSNRRPFCNDLMKINRSGDPFYPRNIRVLGNVIYNHPAVGGDDLIDSVRPGELEISENIFFSDHNINAAQNFITLKRQVPDASAPPDAGSPRYRVSRNIFLNYEGSPTQGFLSFGEDGFPTHEITDAIVENNLFIGNSANSQIAPAILKGVKNVTFRSNTIVGDLPSSAHGFLIGPTGSNPTVSDIFIYNNIWSDPTGTMASPFIDTFGSVDLDSIDLDSNLYWNGGITLPTAGSIVPDDDMNRTVADPLLETNQAGIVLPKWDTTTRQFLSGSTTIRQEFERLVYSYGAMDPGSPAIDAADPAMAPADDILGRLRGPNPDLGAYELDPITSVVQTPIDSRLALSQNSPNPFRRTSTITFVLPAAGEVHLALYDVRGRMMRTLVERRMTRGEHRVVLQGDGIPGGVYFYRLRVGGEGGEQIERRCVVLR